MHCLRRILRRFVEVILGDLQVVFLGDRLGVADPRADNVRWKHFFEFRLPCAPQILE